MKKTLFICAMMLLTVMAYAQDAIKVSPKMSKGDVKEYSAIVTTTTGNQVVTATSETSYVVADVLPDGYVLDVTTTKFESDAKSDDLTGKLMNVMQGLIKDYTLRLKTDKDGHALKILNYDEIKGKLEEHASKLFDEALNTPGFPPVITKDVLMQQYKEKITEEALLVSLQNSSSPLMLNGKSITTGTEEEFVHDMINMKAKRTYTVNGNVITASGTMNMSEEDMKSLIISQVEKIMPSQAEMIKQNIDMVLSSGMVKMEMDEKTTYELQDDGWVKSVKGNTTMSMMGTSTQNTHVISLKNQYQK